jgi:hypothetical protein
LGCGYQSESGETEPVDTIVEQGVARNILESALPEIARRRLAQGWNRGQQLARKENRAQEYSQSSRFLIFVKSN